MTRIVVDPVTRIEGHLRIDVEVEGGSVRNSWSSGQMWRGIEVILKGTDPRDAWMFTQRICGVCTTVHAITSVRAVENALGMEVPLNAQYIRNLILIGHALHEWSGPVQQPAPSIEIGLDCFRDGDQIGGDAPRAVGHVQAVQLAGDLASLESVAQDGERRPFLALHPGAS